LINQNFIKEILSQKHQSVARAISIIENNDSPNVESILSGIYNETGQAYRIGITGPPGAGKSSITNEIIKLLSSDKKIAVLSVDPTSPFTGGAILGDRIRMIEHYNNPNVFIRSLGSRGSKGGLADNISFVGDVLDAAGFDIIIFETVGVGQIELDVMETSDTTVVVLVPESGDDIQILKAGMMEIADIFVVNKSDRAGSEKINLSLNNFLSIIPKDENKWYPKVVKTSVYDKYGFDELLELVFERQTYLNNSGEKKQKNKNRYLRQIQNIISDKLTDSFWNDKKRKILEAELGNSVKARKNPLILAKELLNE
tara:strand:- start:2903 stop:3841 length:939 start_codon:yes stop_codon:yes gene_type:complete